MPWFWERKYGQRPTGPIQFGPAIWTFKLPKRSGSSSTRYGQYSPHAFLPQVPATEAIAKPWLLITPKPWAFFETQSNRAFRLERLSRFTASRLFFVNPRNISRPKQRHRRRRRQMMRQSICFFKHQLKVLILSHFWN